MPTPKKEMPPGYLKEFDAFIIPILPYRELYTIAALEVKFATPRRTQTEWMKERTGLTMEEHIRELLFRVAAEMLRSGEFETVAEVRRKLRVRNEEKFSKGFKFFYGFNPANYKAIFDLLQEDEGNVLYGGVWYRACRKCGEIHDL
jgi:hypothetical protein